MPKKEKLSDNAEFKKLIARDHVLNDIEMPKIQPCSKKLEFEIAEAKYLDNDSGQVLIASNSSQQLIAVPRDIKDSQGDTVYEGWTYGKHSELKSQQFENHFLYCQWRVFREGQVIEFHQRLTAWWLEKADVQLKMMQLIKKRRTAKKLIDAIEMKKAIAKLEDS